MNVLDCGNELVKSQPTSEDLKQMQVEIVDLGSKWSNLTTAVKEKSRKVSLRRLYSKFVMELCVCW